MTDSEKIDAVYMALGGLRGRLGEPHTHDAFKLGISTAVGIIEEALNGKTVQDS